jgi:hypothetical protein
MLSHSTDHLSRGRALLLAQFKGKQNVEALLGAALVQVQELEDAIYGMLIGRWLPNAVGVQLDNLGKIVGQRRGTRDDDAYRRWIHARAMINRSSGTVEDIYKVVRRLLGEGATWRFEESFPATFSVYANEPIAGDEGNNIVGGLQHAKPAGVRALFHWRRSENTFRFAPGNEMVPDAVHGFGAGQFAAVSDGRRVNWWEP